MLRVRAPPSGTPCFIAPSKSFSYLKQAGRVGFVVRAIGLPVANSSVDNQRDLGNIIS